MSRERAKGTAFETAVVGVFRERFPHVERRAMSGVLDRGDLAGVPGFVIECKAHKTPSFGVWLREAEAERVNAGVEFGAVVSKCPGKGPSDSLFVMRLEDAVRLIEHVANVDELRSENVRLRRRLEGRDKLADRITEIRREDRRKAIS